jgi:hypothetical protein
MFENLFHRNKPAEVFNTRCCSMRAETVKDEERSVQAVFSTENPVSVYDYRTGRVINESLLASGCVHSGKVPMLDNHYRYSLDAVLGSGREISTEGNSVVGRLFFDEEDERSVKYYGKMKRGHLTDVSVGYRVLEYQDIAPREKRTINGRAFDGGRDGLRVTTKWELREISLVPIGADQAAKIRSEMGLGPSTIGKEIAQMNERLKRFLISMGLRADASDEEATNFLRSLSPEMQKRAEDESQKPEPQRSEPATAPVQSVDVDKIRAEVEKAETERVRGINALAGDDVPAEVIRKALDEHLTVDQARAEVLKAVRAGRAGNIEGAPAVHGQKEVTRETLAYGLLLRNNLPVYEKGMSEEKKRAAEKLADAGEKYRDCSLLDVCREVVAITGARDPQTGGAPHGREAFIRAAVSSGTLQNIFGVSVHASLMQAYTEAPDTTDFVAVTEHSDFKAYDVIDVTANARLERLGRGETAKHATISDSKQSYKIARLAKQGVIDEQDIIDDNMGALNRMWQEFGQAAARVRPDLVYSLLLSNPTLATDSLAVFEAGTHKNITTAALDSTAIKAAATAMRKQTKNGVNLNISPMYLVCAADLDWTARELLNSSQILIKGSTDAERGNRNVVADIGLQIRSDARISNGVTNPLTGVASTGSATAWFLVASPSMVPTIEVAYLSGTGRRPTIRSFVLDRGQWGVGYDMKLDIGAQILDYRGLFKGNA